MKFASLKSQHRDGELLVVSRDLTRAINVSDQFPTLQVALDSWEISQDHLQEIYARLNADRVESFAFDPTMVSAPLPRAYQWADGSAYVKHVELVRKARGAAMPENFWTDPLMYQGGSDRLLGPTDDIWVADEAFGIDFEAEIAVITDDVAMGTSAAEAMSNMVLFMLVNDVSLRHLIPQELAKGFGFFQSKPSSSFSPVAVTPDELGSAWDGSRVHLPLLSMLNGAQFGAPNAGVDMTFDFAQLIEHAAKTRDLTAGSIIGSGTVSNLDKDVGSSCIIEQRMLETLHEGAPKTEFMKFGDRIKIEMLDADGQSIFGAIDQEVKQYRR